MNMYETIEQIDYNYVEDSFASFDFDTSLMTLDQFEFMCSILKKNIEEGLENEWKNFRISFDPLIEKVNVYGMRKKTEKELDADKDYRDRLALAQKLAVSEYEAEIIQSLIKRNKLPKLGDLI